MYSATPFMTPRASLPVIDVSPLFGGAEQEIMKVAKQLDHACRTSGFLYVVGHPIKQEQIDRVLQISKTFFSLPMEEKMKIDVKKGFLKYRGYVPFGAEEPEHAKTYSYEAFNMGYHLPLHHPEVMARAPLRGPNVHPTQVPEWVDIMETYFRDMWAFMLVLLRAMARGIGIREDFFDDKFSVPQCELTVKHYPEPKTHANGNTLRMEHSDYGIITILYQDSTGGLQVRNPDDKLVDVPPIEGSFVVNIGDMMEMWTNGRYRSTKHCVVSRGKERYSIPFFCNPNPNALVKCLDNCYSDTNPPKYPPVKASDWLLKRLADLYSYKSKM
ncbi:iron/ascorbate oxidoreductase family protein, putative [Trypanosoma brucei brucei TREU927]|uniref:Iron/ascorbate oxidoreductase family protein, putative n=1 Tax=Trypanosoma brucei brucei (strain 927/4 GUTat10.1) TaxID=185431 RepID=Q38D10_TRYB2|nr:iron/ascorbate oxidoreductase family protein, putative [Trypanosoma brucei brucei TREU927]EAN77310.1 iron/ascorbate oxidoreductase family protein, putative [Trypanosoma brucei brucei TREU927]